MSGINICTPFFSIVIPAYNSEKYISKCLDSVCGQTFDNWEAVVVNDGSQDRTLNIVNSYAEREKRVRLINKNNGGVSSARNVALDNIKGKYILFLDSDDWFEFNYCTDLYNILEQREVDLVFSTKFYFNESTLYIAGKNSVSYPDTIIDSLSKFTYSFSMACIKSSLFSDNIRFNENLHYYEDGELLTRILSLRPTIAYNEKPSFHYRQGSVTHSKLTYKTLSQTITLELLDDRFRGISKRMDCALNTRFVDSIAGMVTIGAMDIEHDSEIDQNIKLFVRKHIKKIFASNSKKSFIIKCILAAISPRLAYKIINIVR